MKTGSGMKESCAPSEGHGHLILQNLSSFFNLALFWFLLYNLVLKVNCNYLVPHTFTVCSIRRQLISSRTRTQNSPGFISAHMATSTIVHKADTPCRRRNFKHQRHRRRLNRHKTLYISVFCDNQLHQAYRRLWAHRFHQNSETCHHTARQQIDMSPQDTVCCPHCTNLGEKKNTLTFLRIRIKI